jgi:hypothetical protein
VALADEVRKQEAELQHLRQLTCDSNTVGQQLEAQVSTDMHEENATQRQLQADVAAMTLACQKTAELNAERRSLLEAISVANWKLGQQALAAAKCADLENQASEANRSASKRTKTLRASLRSLGDEQAALAEEEEAERSKRRQLREAVRVRLHRHASERAEIERRLAGRNAELEKWQQRIDASKATEKQALEEAQRLREQAQRCESHLGPQKPRERAEITGQRRDPAPLDEHRREELRQANARLWRKEQLEREMGGRPWAMYVESTE